MSIRIQEGGHEISGALKYMLKKFEKMPIKLCVDPEEGALHIARYIALAIRQKQQDNQYLVLGLATGSSPIRV